MVVAFTASAALTLSLLSLPLLANHQRQERLPTLRLATAKELLLTSNF